MNEEILFGLRIFPEHRATWTKLTGVPRSKLNWSILCPGIMHELSSVTYPLDHHASAENLLIASNVAPEWSSRLLCVPLIGGYLNIMTQASSFGTALEDNADLIARDLLQGLDSVWAYQKVGVKEKRKPLRRIEWLFSHPVTVTAMGDGLGT
ncbi:hypothetical protein V502_03798 [Pseudogymnoascus sp. VKM F-4520 (FW-2644)]|nr:hypothetical protein V502_03798 [Pseudogymnoascus sp. VKM F-4520 (FW-2644)]